MTSPRLRALKGQFDELKQGIDTINRAATDAGRDLTDAEAADLDALFNRAEALKPQIEAEADRENSMNAVSDILSRVNAGAPTSINRAAKVEEVELTAGEFISAALQRQAGMDTELVQRASQVLADTSGIVPTPIVGALIELYDATRPVWNSFAARPMPDKGKTFTRPEITQHVLTGDQATELTAVASQKMVIGGTPVTKFTEAGYLDLSVQDIDWTDPAAMQLVLQDFAKVYSRRMEVRASAYLEATVTAESPFDFTTVKKTVETFVDAFAAVDAAAQEDADTIWMDKTTLATLAQLTNTGDDRTAMSMVREALSEYGVNGVNVVIGRQLTGVTVGSSRLVESYEQNKGLLQVAQPDVLGQRVAYHGYGALFLTPEGFVRLSNV